jgi:hypothetical protein
VTLVPALGLRPNGDAYKLGLAYSAGSTAWSLIDDEPADDSSYVRSPAGTTYPANKLHVRLTDLPALGSNQRVKAVRQRARVRMNAADPGRRGSVSMRPWDPQSGLGVKGAKVVEEPAGVVDQFSLANATTFQPVTGMWRTRPPPADGREWTRAIVNRLVLHIAWNYSAGAAHENLRLSEVYLDVDVRDQPVVTGVAVAGWDTTTRPTVSWDFVPNADADPQQAYQAKVFYAAQAAAPGFNPDTAPTQWDSGVVPAGAAFSAQVGADLVNGQSYKAYVRAAIDFNNANWFSAWASSAAFTISLEPPPIPTLAVEPDQRPCVLRNKLTVVGLLNLLSTNQASLETDLAGWQAGQDTAIARVTTQAAHGIASLQLTRTTAGNGMMWANTTAGVLGARVAAGQTYTAVASFRPATTARKIRPRIAFYDQAGTYIGQVIGNHAQEVAGAWVEAAATGPAPQGAVTAAIEVRVGGDAADLPAQNEVHYVDKVGLLVGGAGNLLTVNQASLETDTSGWVAGAATTIARSTSQAAHGAASLQLTKTGATGLAFANTPAGLIGVPVEPGLTYTAMISYRPATTPRKIRTRLAFYDAAGAYIGELYIGFSEEVAGAWVEDAITGTAPAGAAFAAVEARIGLDGDPPNQPVAGEVHYLDKVGLLVGPAGTAWTPGDSWSPGGFVGNTSLVIEYSWATVCPGNLANPQLAYGGDGFLRNADGFTATGAWPTAVSYDKTLARSGEGSIFWDLHDPAGRLFIGWGESPAFDPAPAYPLASVPGRSYRFGCWARCKPDTASFLTTPWVQALDKDGNPVGAPQQGAQVLVGQEWAELAVDGFTVPDGACWSKAYLTNAAAAAVAHLNVDDVNWHLLPPRGCAGLAVNPCGNPTVWKPLRGADIGDLLAPNVDAQLVVYDNEVPPGATVTYRARAYSTLNDGLSSDFTPYVQTMLEPPGQGVYVLGDPTVWATTNRMCIRVTSIRESQHEEATTFYPLRPSTWQRFNQRPVTVSDYMGGHDGELEIVVASEDEWWLLRQLLHTNRPLWLVWPDFGGRWIRVTDRSWDRQGYDHAGESWRRRVRVPFLEANRPT